MISFLPIQFCPRALLSYEKLFLKCFPKSQSYKFGPSSLEWLYQNNPAGKAIGFDAWEGGNLAAHYVCVPARARIEGSIVNVLLSLNTATHPEYCCKGLFTKLGELTYEEAIKLGYDSVYGVANANSTPGFIRKLGFQFVGQLDAKVGIGSIEVDFRVVSEKVQFERVWSADELAWRCANPRNTVFVRKGERTTSFYAASAFRFLPVYTEHPAISTLALGAVSILSPVRLYLGLMPNGACRFNGYVSIPKTMRRSPLNLVYRSLSGKVAKLDKERISVSFLDFDAY